MRKTLVIVLVALFETSLATGQTANSADVQWPPNVAGQRARAYLDAFNSGDDRAMRRFYEQHRSPENLRKRPLDVRLNEQRQIREKLGKLTPAMVRAESERVLEVIAKPEKLDLWMGLRVMLEDKPPYYIAEIRIQAASPPTTTLRDYTDWTDLASLAEQARTDCGAPGFAICVVHAGKLDTAVAGVRQLMRSKPIRPDDAFHIGSVGKAMSATVIAALIEDGILQWDTTIGGVLKDVSMRDTYRAVTIEQLMQQRGGLSAFVEFDPEANRRADDWSPTRERAAFVATALMCEPAGKPGTMFQYANASYATAAYMAEVLTEKSWEDLVRERLFAPLEMKRAGFGWPATRDKRNQPRGHFGTPPNLRVQRFDEYSLPSLLRPSGDVHCSIEEFGRFAALHLRGLRGEKTVLKPQTIERLHRAPADSGDSVAYACGWIIEAGPDGEPMHFHAGSAHTFYALLTLYPRSDVAVAVVANAGTSVEAVAKRVTQAAHRRYSKQ